jgi:cAMP-dependent protein kinase regulator
LVNDEPRAATILTIEHCQLVYIDRADFNRIVKFTYEKEIKEKILFLKKVEILSEFNNAALKSLAQVIEWKKFPPGSIIQQEGEFWVLRIC